MSASQEYTGELRQRAVRMVFDVRQEAGGLAEAIKQVSDQWSVPHAVLQQWVEQAETSEAGASSDATPIIEPDPYEEGVQLVQFGALDEAQTIWGAAAESGNTSAAYNLGVLLGQQRSRTGS